MRRIKLFAMLPVLTTALLGACDDDGTGPGPQPAAVRFVHAASATGAVTLRAGSSAIATDVAFANTPASYAQVAAGEHQFAVRAANATTDLATKTANLPAGSARTLLLVKQSSANAIVVVGDTNTAPASGKAKVRIVHATSASGKVDVYVTAPNADLANATPAVTQLDFEKASRYIEVAAGTHQVRLTTAGTKTVVLDVPSVVLAAGQIRTVVSLDPAAGSTTFRSVVLADRN